MVQKQQRIRRRHTQNEDEAAVGGQMTKWNSCPRSLYYKELALRPRRAPHMHIYQAIGTGIVATVSLVALLFFRPQVQSLSNIQTVIDAIAGSAGLSAGVWYFLASNSIQAIVVDWIEPLALIVYRICLFWVKLAFQLVQKVWLFLANNLDTIVAPLMVEQQTSLHTLLFGILGGLMPAIVATAPAPPTVTTSVTANATAPNSSGTSTQQKYRNLPDDSNNEAIIPEERDDNFTFTSMSTSSSLARLDEDHPATATSMALVTPTGTGAPFSITTITTNKKNKKQKNHLQKLHTTSRSPTRNKSSLRYYGASSSYHHPTAYDQD